MYYIAKRDFANKLQQGKMFSVLNESIIQFKCIKLTIWLHVSLNWGKGLDNQNTL